MYLCILQIGLNMKHVKSVPKIVHIEFFCYLLSNICFLQIMRARIRLLVCNSLVLAYI